MNDLLDDRPRANFGGDEIPRANFGTRLAAYVLDCIFLALFSMFTSFLILKIIFWQMPNDDDSSMMDEPIGNIIPHFFRLLYLVTYIISWPTVLMVIAYALIEALTGASLGKRVLGLKIGSQDAKTATVSAYLLRSLFKNLKHLLYICLLLVSFENYAAYDNMRFFINLYSLVFFVSCLFALRTNRLALHDLISGTAVYKKIDLDQAD